MPRDIASFLPLPPRDYLVLFALTDGERHGYGIVKDVEALTEGLVTLDPSNLYRSIKRLIDDGLVAESSQRSTTAGAEERRRYYSITSFGKDVVAAEAERFSQLADAARSRRLIPGG
jgi:DNA-binding PadR family transcriptional regulator